MGVIGRREGESTRVGRWLFEPPVVEPLVDCEPLGCLRLRDLLFD